MKQVTGFLSCRDTFLKMIEAANDELRTLHATNKGAPRPVSIPSAAAPGSAVRPSGTLPSRCS